MTLLRASDSKFVFWDGAMRACFGVVPLLNNISCYVMCLVHELWVMCDDIVVVASCVVFAGFLVITRAALWLPDHHPHHPNIIIVRCPQQPMTTRRPQRVWCLVVKHWSPYCVLLSAPWLVYKPNLKRDLVGVCIGGSAFKPINEPSFKLSCSYMLF